LVPFVVGKLDRLMDESGIDWIVATSKHNVQYLLGGYRYFFFEHFDAMGTSRYQAAVGYRKGDPHEAFYVGTSNERWQLEAEHIWAPTVELTPTTTYAAAEAIATMLQRRGTAGMSIGIEPSFLPADAMTVLSRALSDATFVDATRTLEELRAVKTTRELDLIRTASDVVVRAMLRSFESAQRGITKQQLAEAYKRELVSMGLDYDYALVATGPSFNRAPSQEPWKQGAVLSLDSGGHLHGYLGDLCRMAVMGSPTAPMEAALAEIASVQAAARQPIRAGILGGEIIEAAKRELAHCGQAESMAFVAHGMGLVPHEAPHLMDRGIYAASHATQPLAAGMVISIETEMRHPELGLVKLEDTVIVTDEGWEGAGDEGRGWNLAGKAPPSLPTKQSSPSIKSEPTRE
jgi:Xaa-Pro aminopeptidase